MFGDSFNLQTVKGHTMTQAGIAELLHTFMLCLVGLYVARSVEHAGKYQFHGSHRLVIIAGAYLYGSTSMGGLNPACR